MSSFSDGLLLHLPLNEILDGNRVFDSTSNRLNGIVHNTKVVDDPDFGRCLELAGNNDSYIELSPLQATVDFSQGFTVEAWVKITGEIGGAILELADESGEKSIVFHFYSNYFYLMLQTNLCSFRTRTLPDPLPVNQWLHVAVSISPDIDPDLLYPDRPPTDKQEKVNKIKSYASSGKIADRIKFYINGETQPIYLSDPNNNLNEEDSISFGREKYETSLSNFVSGVETWAKGGSWPKMGIVPLLSPLNLSRVECKRNLLGKSGLSSVEALAGRLAQVRVYTRSLSQDEIRWDMQEDHPIKHQFRTAYPIDFSLENADAQPVLFLNDNPNGQDMTLRISNMSRSPIQIVEQPGPASPTNYHLELRFRSGTLAQGSLNKIKLPDQASQDGWSLSVQPGQQLGQGDSLYLLRTKPLRLTSAESAGSDIVLLLQQVVADSVAGTRGTRILLHYNKLQTPSGETISGIREQFLDVVNFQSRTQIPLSYNSATKDITVQGNLRSLEENTPLQVSSALKVIKGLSVDGSVAIGTTTVSNPQGWNKVLEVFGQGHARFNVRSSGEVITSVLSHDNWNRDGVARGGIGTVSNHPLTLITNYIPRMTIDDRGNVGIGIPTPGQKLQVAGGNAAINKLFLGDVGHGDDWAGLSHVDSVGRESYALLQNRNGQTTLINKRAGEGYIGFRIGNQDKVVIDDRGNVGIGIPTPGQKLQVAGGNAVINKLFLGDVGLGDEWAGLAHSDSVNLGNYALLQNRDHKFTFINKRSGGGYIGFCVDTLPMVVIDDRGYMGIGTRSPQAKLCVIGGVNIGKDTDDPGNGNLTVTGQVRAGNIEAENIEAGYLAVGIVKANELTVSGSLSAQQKQFLISHPTKPNYSLVHACVEGPEIGVYYRGNGQLVDGKAVIKLPDYFEALTRKAGRTVLLTAKGQEPFLLSYEDINDGEFNVYGTKEDGEFDWEVKAVRSDVEELEVEVRKA